jgi:hypothetical protein
VDEKAYAFGKKAWPPRASESRTIVQDEKWMKNYSTIKRFLVVAMLGYRLS